MAGLLISRDYEIQFHRFWLGTTRSRWRKLSVVRQATKPRLGPLCHPRVAGNRLTLAKSRADWSILPPRDRFGEISRTATSAKGEGIPTVSPPILDTWARTKCPRS